MDKAYDYIIVGAGISGLLAASKISKRYPKAKVAVMEAYGSLGGRVQSYRKDGLSWEKGAGRIHSSHKMVKDLVNKYGLTPVKIPDSTSSWPAIASIIIESCSKLSKQELQLNTLKEILNKVLNPKTVKHMLSQFPYTSEISSLRADLALESFRKELGVSTGYFYTLAEGLQALTDNLAAEAKVKYFFDHRLTSFKYGTPTTLIFSTKEDTVEFTAKKVILAIHSEGLKGISQFKNLPILKKITMNPLLRIYGVFPSPWFSQIPRTVTDSPLRHVIPINAKKGTIMTSYTDGEDTKFWMKILKNQGEKGVSKRIINELEELFQQKIPEPEIFKMYYWKEGCSYWLPGLYDVHEYSKAIMQPLPKNPNIFVCGESYAVSQCWVESALEHTNEMLNRYIL